MFKDYFFYDNATDEELKERHKRIIAVTAAYELAKTSASSAGGDAGAHKLKFDLEHAAANISKLADAIEEALEK